MRPRAESRRAGPLVRLIGTDDLSECALIRSRLDLNGEYGVALAATLAMQTDKAPAQYQFKHLSFQEGLYAEYLLITVTSLTPPAGPGWPGWVNDKAAAEFLNNRYMENHTRQLASDGL